MQDNFVKNEEKTSINRDDLPMNVDNMDGAGDKWGGFKLNRSDK